MIGEPLNRNKSIGISCMVFMAYVLFYMTGSNSGIHNYIQILLFALWNVTAYTEDPKSYFYAISSRPTRFLLLFLMYFFLTGVIKGNVIYLLTYIGVYLMIYSGPVQFLYYYRRNRLKEIKCIVYLSFIGWIIISGLAITFYSLVPDAARTLAADTDAFGNLYIGGGYAIAFGSAILFSFLVPLLFRRLLSFKKSILVAFVAIILLILIVKTQSTTTLIAAVIGSIVGIFYEIRNRLSNKKKVLFYIFSVGLIVLLLNGGLTRIAFQLSGSASEKVYAKRFHRIGEKLASFETGSSSENYVDERWGDVVESFNTFFDYPVFGVGYMAGHEFSKLNIYSKDSEFKVGAHSEICDSLAKYGMIGCFFFFGFFIFSIERTNREIKNRSYLVTLFIMALMNPFQYFHGFYVLFVLMPCIYLLLIQRKRSTVLAFILFFLFLPKNRKLISKLLSICPVNDKNKELECRE